MSAADLAESPARSSEAHATHTACAAVRTQRGHLARPGATRRGRRGLAAAPSALPTCLKSVCARSLLELSMRACCMWSLSKRACASTSRLRVAVSVVKAQPACVQRTPAVHRVLAGPVRGANTQAQRTNPPSTHPGLRQAGEQVVQQPQQQRGGRLQLVVAAHADDLSVMRRSVLSVARARDWQLFCSSRSRRARTSYLDLALVAVGRHVRVALAAVLDGRDAQLGDDLLRDSASSRTRAVLAPPAAPNAQSASASPHVARTWMDWCVLPGVALRPRRRKLALALRRCCTALAAGASPTARWHSSTTRHTMLLARGEHRSTVSSTPLSGGEGVEDAWSSALTSGPGRCPSPSRS